MAVIAAAILFILYVYAAEGSEHSNQIRGAIVCAALTWELWMSGGTFTNKSSALMPRWARVTVLIGYLVLVATCTFFFVTTTVTYSEQVWLGFDTEPLVAAGIVGPRRSLSHATPFGPPSPSGGRICTHVTAGLSC